MRSSQIDLWAAVVPSRYSVFCSGFFMFWDGVIHPHAQAIALLDLTQQAGSHLDTITHDFPVESHSTLRNCVTGYFSPCLLIVYADTFKAC